MQRSSLQVQGRPKGVETKAMDLKPHLRIVVTLNIKGIFSQLNKNLLLKFEITNSTREKKIEKDYSGVATDHVKILINFLI